MTDKKKSKKIYNPLKDESRFQLQDFFKHRTYHSKRDYVEQQMTLLAEDGSLYLTGLMMLGPEVTDIVGDIILDFTRSSGSEPVQRKADETPEFVENMTFNVVNVDDFLNDNKSDVVYQDGKLKANQIYSMAMSNGFRSSRGKIVIKRPRHLSVKPGKLSAKQAFLALKQNGLWVKHHPDRKTGEIHPSACMEIPPWEKEESVRV